MLVRRESEEDSGGPDRAGEEVGEGQGEGEDVLLC